MWPLFNERPKDNVEALQWKGDNVADLVRFIAEAGGVVDTRIDGPAVTLIGPGTYRRERRTAVIGDWFVKRDLGFDIYSSLTFERTYEPVDVSRPEPGDSESFDRSTKSREGAGTV